MPVPPPPAERIRPAPRDAKLVRYNEYIDTQIRSTQWMVKVVDVATVLVVTAVGVLAFLLTAAIVEHWLVPGGFNTLTRFVLFAVLAGGFGYYLLRRLWPLSVRSINPVYAAQTIEQGSPSLKNSLLNLLLFRQRRGEITDAVYETLERQAAERLVRVPVDSAVDRTHLIRLGYALVAIVAVAALYKIFSPKDPLVTAERVLMPWADVVPASRVSISNVEPGTTTLARGELLDVSAEVRGVGEDDPVVVRYTTADGQAVDRPIQMSPTAAGLRFVARLPDSAGRGADEPIGVAQNLRYRIEAGDARSLDYAVTVVAAPTITVQRIDYEYPAYTGFAARTIDGLGDVRAIEGTRVTIHARANGPVDEAQIDFEADGRRDVRMEVEGTRASGSFVLALRDDRQTPRFTSYALRYTSTDGRPNRDPVKFRIDVLRDYSPEVAILSPAEKVRDVRLDETVALEVEARDPDFALADVRLHGEVAGQAVFEERLLASEHAGRFTGRLNFTPRDYKLQAGDVVQYWVAARDNRSPAPNEAKSERQTLRISSPDPNQPPPDRVAQRDRQRPQPGGEQQQHGEQQDQPGQEQPGDGESASADGDAPQDGQQSGEESADGQSGGDPSAGGGSSGRQPGDDSQQQPPGGESASADGTNQPGDQQQPGAGESLSGDAERSAVPRDGHGEQSPNGQQRDRSEDASDGQRRPAPVSPEGDNDGEAFDRIRKFLQREGELAEQDDSKQFSRDAERSAPNDGPGAETRPGDPAEESADPPDGREDSPSPGGQQTSSKGPSGAGDQPEQNQGVPDSQPGMKPADKWQQTPSGDQAMDDQEPPAGGRGKRESDSQGEQGGDRAGGGEEGGGQQANREGTGSAGQNQSADEGSGESSEQGSGNTSPDAGRDAAASERSGESGTDEPGQGSSQRDGAGDQPGGQRGEQTGGEDAPARSDGEDDAARSDGEDDAARSDGDQPFSRDARRSADGESASADGQQRHDSTDRRRDQQSDRDGQTPGGEPGGQPAGAGPPSTTGSTAPEGDAANLEYARKQTDLVLERLADQLKRRKVDKRLLDELGWSERDLARFLDRWRELEAAAERNTPQGHAARRELDGALRSLGLGRGPLGPSQVRQDDLRDLQEGYRGAVPQEYQERLRAYNEGVSRSRRSGE
jgi:hypothetical protein